MSDLGNQDRRSTITQDHGRIEQDGTATAQVTVKSPSAKPLKEWAREIVDNALLMLFYR